MSLLGKDRKGIESLVLEGWESLRTTGVAVDILTNGWRALEVLGIASKLRHTAQTFDRYASSNVLSFFTL